MSNIHQCDAIELAHSLDRGSVDLIISDLPYAVTRNRWDIAIPLEPLWKAFKHCLKPGGAVVLTAMQPFTSLLILSNRRWFRTEWIWDKRISTGYLNAKKQPLRQHESVLVFCSRQPLYNPQMRRGEAYTVAPRQGTSVNYGKQREPGRKTYDGMRYPTSILSFPNKPTENVHSTQKPQALFEYMIRTYSRPGDLVFDPCAGSGTSALAARACGRRFIVGDNGGDDKTGRLWVDVIRERLAESWTPPLFAEFAT